jgi:hypothetical protein
VPAGTIILWFGIITVMCLAFSGLYMYFRKLNRPRSAS